MLVVSVSFNVEPGPNCIEELRCEIERARATVQIVDKWGYPLALDINAITIDSVWVRSNDYVA